MNKPQMSSRELLVSKISSMVSEGKSIKQSDHSWLVSNVDIGNGSSDYLIKATPKLGKSGKTFIKRELYRIDGNTEKMIELGEFKKKYLIAANIIDRSGKTLYNRDIDYGFAEAKTTYGILGVKVWIYKGEVLNVADGRQKEAAANAPEKKEKRQRRPKGGRQ